MNFSLSFPLFHTSSPSAQRNHDAVCRIEVAWCVSRRARQAQEVGVVLFWRKRLGRCIFCVAFTSASSPKSD